jgi:hypothetical protein
LGIICYLGKRLLIMCYLGKRLLIMCFLGEECGDNLLSTRFEMFYSGFDTVLPWGEMVLLRVCFIIC